MTLIIVDIPHIEEERGYKMPDNDWLKLATSPRRPQLATIHNGMTADGYKLFICDGYETECDCGDDEFHARLVKLRETVEKNSKRVFSINRQFLIEILAGLDPEIGDCINFYVDKNEPQKSAIMITAPRIKDRVAIVMPMEPEK